MISLFVLCSIVGVTFGQINLPHGHDLKTIVDRAFARLDTNPANGIVTETEYDVMITRDDTDKDGCISQQEFLDAHSRQPQEVANKMFHHFESDGDNCLSVQDLQHEFHLIDHDNNNELDLHEFEKYYTHLLNTLFGHAHGK